MISMTNLVPKMHYGHTWAEVPKPLKPKKGSLGTFEVPKKVPKGNFRYLNGSPEILWKFL